MAEFTFEDKEFRKTYWHTCSHIMAQAIKRLYPSAKLAIGTAIDEGWYYDIDIEESFTAESLDAIEKEMKRNKKHLNIFVRNGLNIRELLMFESVITIMLNGFLIMAVLYARLCTAQMLLRALT